RPTIRRHALAAVVLLRRQGADVLLGCVRRRRAGLLGRQGPGRNGHAGGLHQGGTGGYLGRERATERIPGTGGVHDVLHLRGGHTRDPVLVDNGRARRAQGDHAGAGEVLERGEELLGGGFAG